MVLLKKKEKESMASHALIPVLECNLLTPEFFVALLAEAVHIIAILGLAEDNLEVMLLLSKFLCSKCTKIS